MKKRYIAPDMEIVEMENERLLAGSGQTDTFDLSDDNGIPSIEGEPVRSNHKSVWDD